ncbi:hypothetical protein [Sphingosinithalassobacter sp. CS137]|uniref:hypothetical protein n=1 Tax=Sphingosinithalassobacter sp. CS137 TaxID=2762748 RepID=UPI00165DFBA7|nr:hypothetical protein [Sphingosinithalassobacter sp. CS137]
MMRSAVVLIAVALAACSPMAGPGTAPTADLPDAIHLTVKSWGVNLHDWRIAADGTGTYTYADTTGETSFMQADQVTKRVSITPAGYARIAAALEPAAPYVRGEPLACAHRITDMPYGTVTFEDDGSESSFDYNIGCQSEAAAQVYDAIAAARDEVAAMTASMPEASRAPSNR